jgi:hypothetical protein
MENLQCNRQKGVEKGSAKKRNKSEKRESFIGTSSEKRIRGRDEE